jgi:hypothetical protein
MPNFTTPDNIVSPASGDGFSYASQMAALAASSQTALTSVKALITSDRTRLTTLEGTDTAGLMNGNRVGAAIAGAEALPNASLRFLAGESVQSTNGSSAITFNFSTPFPNGFLFATCINGDTVSSPGAYGAVFGKSLSAVAFKIFNSNGAPYGSGQLVRFGFMAVGW